MPRIARKKVAVAAAFSALGGAALVMIGYQVPVTAMLAVLIGGFGIIMAILHDMGIPKKR